MNLFASFFLNILQRQNQDYNRAVFAEINKEDFERRKKELRWNLHLLIELQKLELHQLRSQTM